MNDSNKKSLVLGLGFLALVWLIFFSKILFFGHYYFLDDLKILYYPIEHAYAQFQHAWQLPQWSPYFGFGQPLLSWGQLGFFVPLHVALRFLSIPPLALLQISVVGYIGLGLVGMFCLLRRHRLSISAAVLGAVVFALSGFSIGHLNHVNFYTATMLLPWLLLAVNRWWAKPTPRTTAIVSIVGAVIALSGQPQVVAYTFALAALYTMVVGAGARPAGWRPPAIRAGWGIVAAAVALGLASFALLPLMEFVPLTERNGSLSPQELYEFSYPPSHAITLVFPYFFGTHDHYWGAKGFQELAAYVGIIPLLLAGAAATFWRAQRGLRIFGITSVVIGIVFALGKYSPVYAYLVEEHWLTALAVPGRFVYFFDLGIAVLAALGLHDVGRLTQQRSSKQQVAAFAGALVFLALLIWPFFSQLGSNLGDWEELLSLSQRQPLEGWMALGGLGMGSALFFTASWPRVHRALSAGTLALAVGTLVTLGWSYNPTVPKEVARHPSAFGETLRAYEREAGLPARLYSTMRPLLQATIPPPPKTTNPLSPVFSVHQTISITSPLRCLDFDYDAAEQHRGVLHVTIRPALSEAPWRSMTLRAFELGADNRHRLCFRPIVTDQRQAVVSFTGDTLTEVRLAYEAPGTSDRPAYFIRGPAPAPNDFEHFRRSVAVQVAQSEPVPEDREAAYGARHLQVLYNSSSARWISALSIRPYREFIETFFANDRDDVYDGDGVHALVSHRALVDMAGITHLIQPVTDAGDLSALGFDLLEQAQLEEETIGLYRNRNAHPKAWLVPRAEFRSAADETRHAMMQPSFNARQLVYINGPTPPAPGSGGQSIESAGTVTLTRYEPARVEAQVETPEPAWLIVTDATTPQWETYIDGERQPYYLANTTFKAALVPAGIHTVTFEYHSPAIRQAAWLTAGAAILTLLGLLWRGGGTTDRTAP